MNVHSLSQKIINRKYNYKKKEPLTMSNASVQQSPMISPILSASMVSSQYSGVMVELNHLTWLLSPSLGSQAQR
jgi:hypothetical protein